VVWIRLKLKKTVRRGGLGDERWEIERWRLEIEIGRLEIEKIEIERLEIEN